MEWHNLPHNPQPTPQNRSLEQEYSGNNLCPIKCTSHCPGKCRVSVVWTRGFQRSSSVNSSKGHSTRVSVHIDHSEEPSLERAAVTIQKQ
ncbi:uncharacterized protein [Narcine bancroftii]|uniref:uncharacterized protein isoform X4 n=1 Tax=Narcine bancroftii TaxID=1343680 RepID=UPI0038317477